MNIISVGEPMPRDNAGSIPHLAGAAYLAAESIRELASHEQSAHSVAGLVISSAALVVLAVLALAKRRVGQALGSAMLLADAAETGLSAAAAAAALLGLWTVLNTSDGRMRVLVRRSGKC